MTLGQKIHKLRKAKGWTLARLAKEAEKSIYYWSKIENSKELPSPTMILRLATVFGVDSGELMNLARFEKMAQAEKSIDARYK